MPNRLSLLRVLAAIAVLVAALALVACGGGGGDDEQALSKEEYKNQSQILSEQFEIDFQGASQDATSEDPQESLDGVKRIADSARGTATGLDKLKPPSDFEDVHNKLVASLNTVADRGAKVEQAAETEDEAQITPAVESFQQSIKELDPVGKEFDKVVGTT